MQIAYMNTIFFSQAFDLKEVNLVCFVCWFEDIWTQKLHFHNWTFVRKHNVRPSEKLIYFGLFAPHTSALDARLCCCLLPAHPAPDTRSKPVLDALNPNTEPPTPTINRAHIMAPEFPSSTAAPRSRVPVSTSAAFPQLSGFLLVKTNVTQQPGG